MTGPNHNPTVLVEKEKTKRLIIFMSAVVVMGVTALVLFTTIIGDRKGNVTIDPKGGKIEINVEERTVAPFGDTVSVTTRPITDSAAQKMSGDSATSPTDALRNGHFVDRNVGVVLQGTVSSRWTSVERLNDAMITLQSDSSSIHVSKRTVEPTATIQQIAKAEQIAIKRRDRAARVTADVDTTSHTSVIWYTESSTARAVCIKLMLQRGIVYVRNGKETQTPTYLYRAEGAAPGDNAAARKEVIELVTRFAPIARVR
jgi:hypothetical protein